MVKISNYPKKGFTSIEGTLLYNFFNDDEEYVAIRTSDPKAGKLPGQYEDGILYINIGYFIS